MQKKPELQDKHIDMPEKNKDLSEKNADLTEIAVLKSAKNSADEPPEKINHSIAGSVKDIVREIKIKKRP